jgi:hypothetical protein
MKNEKDYEIYFWKVNYSNKIIFLKKANRWKPNQAGGRLKTIQTFPNEKRIHVLSIKTNCWMQDFFQNDWFSIYHCQGETFCPVFVTVIFFGVKQNRFDVTIAGST